MSVRRLWAIGLCLLMIVGGFVIPVAAEDGDDPQIRDQWTECRDGRKYQITEYDDNTTEEEDIGECDSWIVDSWCDGSDLVEEWEDESGRRWEERRYDPGCEEEMYEEGWIVDTWCDGEERIEAWTNEQGDEWQERYPDPGCGDPEHHEDPYQDDYQDPYGCEEGRWWDHYLARCVSEEEWALQDSFWQCTDQAHRQVAEEQKRHDIEAREARQERRAKEAQAMEHERAGRWEEAQRIWDELHRLEWEEQKRFHALESRMADAQNACVDEYIEKARAMGADYLADEFENQRFQAFEPQMPHTSQPVRPMGDECAPPPGDHYDPRYDEHEQYGGASGPSDQPPETRYPDDGRRSPGPDSRDGPGPDSGHGPGRGPGGEGPCGPDPMMEAMDFGLPPEAQEAIKEVMAWCQEQMWQIDNERFAAESYDEVEALEDRIRQVERECREKMERIFREYDRYENEFDQHFGGFTMTETGSSIEVLGVNLLFTGNPETSRIEDFTCQGVPVLDSVRPYFQIEDVWPTGPHKLAFFDHMVSSGGMPDSDRMAERERDAFMVVHDDPHCTVAIKPHKAQGDDAEVKLVFSSLYSCSEQEGHILCADDDGTEIMVRAHGEAPDLLDDRTLMVRDHVVVRLAGGVGDYRALDQYGKNEAFDGSAAVSFKEGELVAQAVTLGDLEMVVRESDDGEGLKITLDKASHVGSFVVVTLDAVEECSVKISGWAVDGDRREALEMRKARNLVDALDTEYDGDWAKYYTVQDEYGCQLIITNSHYSVKEFIVERVEPGGLMNLVPGPGLLVTSLALFACAVALRRRR